MVEEEKSQKVVESYKAVAAGIASVLAAVFTSKLGVAGTLIGTAMAAVLITLGSALFKVQLMKATNKISGLPDTVRGRLSTQQIRIPGRPNAEPNPEPAAEPEAADNRSPGLLSRLRAMPGFLRDLPSNQRRKMLVAGLLAGLVATAIGLTGVTGIELAGGKTLSCLVWSSCSDDDESGGSSRGSGLSILGGYSGTTPSGDPSKDQPSAPGSDQQAPQGSDGEPAQPGAGGTPSQPGGTPQQPGKGTNPAQPGAGPNGSEAEPAQSSGNAPEEGRSQESEDRGSTNRQEKEDRG
ncbi:MAG: hypothetical protein LC781_15950 [Actinobacteria bacterium]|nr:hypothetical protein [Actinomycetota bacterium]